jgi:hypothetical protein
VLPQTPEAAPLRHTYCMVAQINFMDA